jgi:hypothetical protein
MYAQVIVQGHTDAKWFSVRAYLVEMLSFLLFLVDHQV